MKAEKRKRRRNSIIRILLVGVSVLAQAGWILLLVLRLWQCILRLFAPLM